MKLFKNKLLIISSIIILLVISYNALAANTFPTTLNDWSAGETIESDWADALEAKIGIDSSAVVTSLDYKISDIISNYLQLAGGTMTNTLIIDQNSNARGINIDSEAVDWESLKIDSISTIRDAVYFYSNAVKNANVAVLRIQDNNASNQQPAFIVDQNGNGQSINIDSEATSATVLNIDAVNTSGNIVNVDSKFVIDYAGNVGIGTSSPYGLLHITDGSVSTISAVSIPGSMIISDDGAPRIYFENTGEGAGDKVMGIDYATESLIFRSYNDASNVLDVNNILVVNRDGNVGIATATPAMKFSVHGDALADSWNVYSNIYQGEALSKLKNIKAEKDEKGDWVKVDHDTLPEGVVSHTQMDGYVLPTMSIDALAQMNTKAIQELHDLTLQQQAEITALKMRLHKLDGLGTDLVVVDEEGNLLSNSLWAGFGVILTGLLGAWCVKRKK